MIKYAVLTFGYMEHATVGCHIYRFRGPGPSPVYRLEALKFLADDFYKLYKHELDNCGLGDRGRDRGFDVDDFKNWLYELGFADCNSFPSIDGTGGFGRWWPYDPWAQIVKAQLSEVLVVPEKAEELIIASLDEENLSQPDRDGLRQFKERLIKFESRLRPQMKTIESILLRRIDPEAQ